MQLIHPAFLFALGALAIPIIIHLFHFRRFKKVYFTNVHLLQELKEETSTRSRLRSLLILLARCAALACLVLAFAQPVKNLASIGDKKDQAVEVIVDNSYSMQSRTAEVPLLTLVKDQAKEIINSHSPAAQYLILTHDLQAKHQRYVDQETALSFVEDIRITPSVETLPDLVNVVERISKAKPDHAHHLYILSDFQSNISEFETPIDTSFAITLVPNRAAQEDNVALTGATWTAPVALQGQANQLIVTLENFGDEEEAVELRMDLDGQQRPLGTVSIAAHSTTTDTVNVTVSADGWHQLSLSIDDFPVEFDNQLYTSFLIKESVKVLSVYSDTPNQYVSTALDAISNYQLMQQSARNIRYEIFQEQDLIILDDLISISSGLSNELVKYVESGGNLLIFPAINADLTTYHQLLARLKMDRLIIGDKEDKTVSRINTEAFTFQNVYTTTKRNIKLPRTAQLYKIQSSARRAGEWLLKYRTGEDYLKRYQFGEGNAYLCAAPLDIQANDLVRNAEVFVPMLYKMALSSGSVKPLYYTIGQDDVIQTKDLPQVLSERYTMSGPTEFIPAISRVNNAALIDVRDQIREAGYYDLKDEATQLGVFAYNHDRIESDVTYADIAKLSGSLGSKVDIIDNVAKANLSSYIKQETEGIRLWRWCLIGALLFLLIETLLIRLWKG